MQYILDPNSSLEDRAFHACHHVYTCSFTPLLRHYLEDNLVKLSAATRLPYAQADLNLGTIVPRFFLEYKESFRVELIFMGYNLIFP